MTPPLTQTPSLPPRQVVYAGNHLNGLNVLRELRRLSIEIEFLLVHPRTNSRCREELVEESGTPPERIITWEKKEIDGIVERLQMKQADVLFSANFGYRFPQSVLALFKRPVNLHLSLLPYNKGAFPNVWAIIDGTPAGVSLHLMNDRFDEGPILFQSEVPVAADDTAMSLYQRLMIAAVNLVRDHGDDILHGRITPWEQPPGGTAHVEKEFYDLLRLDLERHYRAGDLINLLRAMTFPPHANLYFEHNEGRTHINLQLCREGNTPAALD